MAGVARALHRLTRCRLAERSAGHRSVSGPLAMLLVKDLNQYYGGSHILRNLSFEVPAGGAGDYRVMLEYSCADNSAGNTAVVEANGQSLTGKVASSGGWGRATDLPLFKRTLLPPELHRNNESQRWDLNPHSPLYESGARPIELRRLPKSPSPLGGEGLG